MNIVITLLKTRSFFTYFMRKVEHLCRKKDHFYRIYLQI